jgi:hypothetical protein
MSNGGETPSASPSDAVASSQDLPTSTADISDEQILDSCHPPGMATYTDQSCSEPGIYYVRKEGNGYAFDVKSETCSADFAKLLFVPGKPKK